MLDPLLAEAVTPVFPNPDDIKVVPNVVLVQVVPLVLVRT